MTDAALQLTAVVIGGFIAIAGGFISSRLLETQRLRREERNLALAFKGEISAILELIRERNYIARFAQVIDQIESTGKPFFMPFRVRRKYDRVYEANVARLGLLKPPLPEAIPIFFTRFDSILEDLVSLGDGTYAALDLPIVLRVYNDTRAATERLILQGNEILRTIQSIYERRR